MEPSLVSEITEDQEYMECVKDILCHPVFQSMDMEEIKDYYEHNPDNKDRTAYIKSIFNNDYTELTLEDGRTVGYKTFENVLHLWEGKYDSRTAQSYYDWAVIALSLIHISTRKVLTFYRRTLNFRRWNIT